MLSLTDVSHINQIGFPTKHLEYLVRDVKMFMSRTVILAKGASFYYTPPINGSVRNFCTLELSEEPYLLGWDRCHVGESSPPPPRGGGRSVST